MNNLKQKIIQLKWIIITFAILSILSFVTYKIIANSKEPDNKNAMNEISQTKDLAKVLNKVS